MAEKAVTDRAPSAKTEKKARDDDEFLALIRKRFDRVSSAESVNRKSAIEDLKFKNGEQWPESIRSDRTMQKRPCLTVNKIKTFVHQITNDQRQNRPAINVSPVGDRSDPHTAKMLKGLIRQIERQSNADIAYDTGFDGAVSNGWGYWRVLTEYEDEDSFDQVIKIGRIRNPFRVYLDPDHQEPDGSDAQWAFISDLIPRQEFEETYPDKDPMQWEDGAAGDEFKNWTTNTHVRIAEYFYYETDSKKLLHLANGHVGFEDDLSEEIKAQIKENPDLVTKTREVQAKKIKWVKVSGRQVLEENDWSGKWIPIVKCIGDEVDVEGKVTLAGLVRDAKDPQRMYNYWVTAETEQVALMPKAPYIMAEGQIEGHDQRWKRANDQAYPYLLYKPTDINGKLAPPPQRQPFAGPPAGVVQAKIAAAQDMQATTGIRFDATLQERTYDESGKALRELKRTGDLGNFHYVDNLARSLRHTGRILIDLIPKIYDTPRILTILREDDSEEQVRIDPTQGVPHMKGQVNGKEMSIFNPKVGTYEVAVTIGPSFATKRAEAADSLLQFMKVYPQSAPVIGDLIAKNMDWPGAEDIAARLAVMLPPQVQMLLGKKMSDFPPEAKALIVGLSSQIQKLTQEHKTALHLLGEKQTEQGQRNMEIANQHDKINKDFEAKLTKIVAEMEKAGLQTAQKVYNDVEKLATAVQGLEKELSKPKPEDKKDSPSRASDHKELAQALKHVGDALAAQGKPRKRTGKMKGPSGKVYEMEMTEQ